MLNRFLGITVLSLLTTACGSMEVTDFVVNDREYCADTGICELALILEADGTSFRPSRHYPALDARDSVNIQWGDSNEYQANVVDCVSDGVCQFAPGGLLLRHTYPLGTASLQMYNSKVLISATSKGKCTLGHLRSEMRLSS